MNLGDAFRQANITIQSFLAVGAEDVAELRAEQLASASDLKSEMSQEVNPLARSEKGSKTLKERALDRVKKSDTSEEKSPVEAAAGEYEEKNPELHNLVDLHEKMSEDDTPDDILNKVKDSYKDVSLQDKALDFIIETSKGKIKETAIAAKEKLNTSSGREIKAGHNISEAATAAAKAGVGTPTELRDLYRDITGNPRESNVLFDQLSAKYTYTDLRKVTKFLLQSLGSDLKSGGPSIEPGKLSVCITEIRSLQAIHGVYTFFKDRMPLVDTLFKNAG